MGLGERVWDKHKNQIGLERQEGERRKGRCTCQVYTYIVIELIGVGDLVVVVSGNPPCSRVDFHFLLTGFPGLVLVRVRLVVTQ